MKKNKKRRIKTRTQAARHVKMRGRVHDLLSQALDDHKKGDLGKAEIKYQQILKREPLNPDALHLRGVLKSQQGEYAWAVKLIKQAIQQYPTHADFHINLGNALANQGQLEAAIDSYAQALKLNPDHVEAHHNMGNLMKKAGRFPDALAHFQLALQLKPDTAEVYNDLGNVLVEIGQIDDSLSHYRRALELKPIYPEALNNMGTAFKILERFPEALQYYDQAIRQHPGYAEAYNNLGATLAAMDKPDEATAYFHKALELKPDYVLAMVDLYYALKRTCSWADLADLDIRLDTANEKALKHGGRIAEDPFLSLARSDDPNLNLAVARSWSMGLGTMAAHINTNFTFNGNRRTNQKITIGYLSKNFRNHAMAHLMAGLFECHDRSRFNVYGYSIGADDKSIYRQRIEKGCDRFIDIRTFDHITAARAIFEDQVDILIDLMGFTRGNRLEIAAFRPAPIQARFMGMAGTTGADFFDYLIADQAVVPPDQHRFYSEKLVYLPGCYQINDSRQTIADITYDRQDLGLPSQGFIFCSFNQLFKLDPIMFATWMAVLKEVPGSILWLQAGPKAAEQNLLAEAKTHGIEPERIIFGQRMPKAEHLARLGLADLALDTRMVSGAATTSDALWAGVPVVTLEGNHFSSRMSASILKAFGMPELVTHSLSAYKDLAIQIARDQNLMMSINEKLHSNRREKSLFDTRHFTRNLENAYNIMWQTFRDGKAPKAIEERLICGQAEK